MGTRSFKGRKVYDTAFKFAVIEEYFSGDLSLNDFCKKKSLDRGALKQGLSCSKILLIYTISKPATGIKKERGKPLLEIKEKTVNPI